MQAMAASPLNRNIMQQFNLSNAKIALVRYYSTGQYSQETNMSIEKAINYLGFRITNNHRLKHHKKLAIVLGIDETALSNYAHMQQLDFGGIRKEKTQADFQANDIAIEDTLHLYNLARQNNSTVFFITNRKKMSAKLLLKI